MSNNKAPTAEDQAQTYALEHLATMTVTVLFGAISAAALFYHIHEDTTFSDPYKLIFAALGGLFAFGMALMPALLAKPHGEAIEGASAQTSILLVVIMVMVVDGALEWHAITLIAEHMGMKAPSAWILVPVIASFQVSMFMTRGALAASTSEQNEMIAAQKERRDAIEAQREKNRLAEEAHQQKLAERRAKYAEQKSRNVVNLR